LRKGTSINEEFLPTKDQEINLKREDISVENPQKLQG